MSHSDQILIIAPSWVGDAIMSQVLLTTLKQQTPSSHITVLARGYLHDLFMRMPEVDAVIDMPLDHGVFDLKKRYQLGRKLREKQYTDAYITPNSWKSALIPFFAGITHRRGWRGEWRYGLLNDCRVLNKKRYPLMIQRFAALAYPKQTTLPDPLPTPTLSVDRDNQKRLLEQFQLETKRPILALCPGAQFGPAKCWPANNFSSVAQAQIKQGWQVVCLGTNADRKACQTITANCPQYCYDLSGKTRLVDAIDILAAAEHVISNDSGLMHVTAALNRPLSAIYGSTTPTFTPPLTDKARIFQTELSCRPCFQRSCPLQHLQCLHAITPKQVLTGIH